MGMASVAMGSVASAARRATRRSTMAGSTKGRSPCTFTTTSASRRAATSASRSVPVGWSGRVIATSTPSGSTASRMRGSSVATMTRPRPRARRVRSATWQIMGRPAISASAFPGRRLD